METSVAAEESFLAGRQAGAEDAEPTESEYSIRAVVESGQSAADLLPLCRAARSQARRMPRHGSSPGKSAIPSRPGIAPRIVAC